MKHSINSKIPINVNVKKTLFFVACGVVIATVLYLLYFNYSYEDIVKVAKKEIARNKFVNAGINDISCRGISKNKTYSYVSCNLKSEKLRDSYGAKKVYYGQKQLATGDYNYFIGIDLMTVKENLEKK